MTSLKRRLVLILLAATGVIWLCATGWIYASSRSELEHVLDTRLQEAARMVHSLVAGGNIAAAEAVAQATAPPEAGYERQLSCQIWSLDGRLVAKSGGAPEEALAGPAEGFSERVVNDEPWRVYTILDPEKGVRVMVGDRIGLRDRLVRDLVAGLLAPVILVVPLLGLLIWISVGRGLAPLHAVAGDIAARDGEDMRPVAPAAAPAEIRPLLEAINGLFAKVEAARRQERDVTAFAAHELRTPLAGLKTQAQIALAAHDAPTREGALRQILVSVDRTTRLVRQLLALAKLEGTPSPPLEASGETQAGALLRDIVRQTSKPATAHVVVDDALDALKLKGDHEALHLMLRNLHENAVEHTVEHMAGGGTIAWRPCAGGLCVEDEGPGIPEDELPLVTRRFYRGRSRSGAGSGLGLTIATMAAARAGARLTLENRRDGDGLRATIVWPRGAA
ncbi:two-component system sensor histidine kinase QseC [Xanthobacter sp. SG618]|uniref:ATP-binding protein n=1 Tax=Xanthobacter sp. SG618 TaxID=2587121 RepID=UPI00145F1E82|nr:ATP-binding protein [Xanthobacter sp. SG618]NMN59603.1 two-component system sensor histidine kinase QseC [Xanthobacter sp. SG618]